MISTLVNLLGGFYENNDFAKVETMAQSIHSAIPGDQVSLKFLGLAYYHTGRIKDAMHVFDRIQYKQSAAVEISPEKMNTVDSAAMAVSAEATLRVPYLAQAWRDLGNALHNQRATERVSPPFSCGCMA